MLTKIYERLFGLTEEIPSTDTGKLDEISKRLDELEKTAVIADEKEHHNRELVARYEMVFKHVKESIFIVDASTGGIVDFNDAAAERLGYTREEFKNISLDSIDALDTHDDIVARCEEIMQCTCLGFDTQHLTKDGTALDVECYSSVIRSNGHTLLQTICHYQD